MSKNLNECIINEINAKKDILIPQVDKKITVCFTGNREKYLPINKVGDKDSLSLINIKYKLKNLIIESIENGYTYFVCGLALGSDLIAGNFVIELKKTYPQITLECALPHANQFHQYSEKNKLDYLNIIKNCDYLKIVQENYNRNCYMKRNKYMVDKSSLVIGIWNGRKGGTCNTLNYAKSKNVTCKLILF